MIITKKGEQLRNLEEQVQYLTNYHNVNQGLVQWGIRVVGQVETVSELPDPATYKGDFGDAYAVGTEAPFFFYIWTRSSVVGEPDYWFPFGEISIVGPQGPKGDKGDKGDTGASTRWYAGAPLPADMVPNPVPGTMYLHTARGDVYEFDNNQWNYKGNIEGPQGIQGIRGPQGERGEQGPQGPKGDTGDVGGFINIFGILSNVDQLPTPASLNNLSVAYLVGENKDLYIQVGETSATATWNNVGPFNAATLVMVNGIAQNVWDADTKLDKSTQTGFLRAYCVNPDASQTTVPVASNANTWKTDRIATLVSSARGSESDRSNMENPNVGYLLSATPTQPFHTANKEYVDENFAPNIIKDYPNEGTVQAVVMTAKTGDAARRYGVYTISTSTAGVQSGRLAQYFGGDSGAEGTGLGNGRILQHDPVQPLQVANKRYVDNKVKTYRHRIEGSLTDDRNVSTVLSMVLYTTSPDTIITPDTTESTIASFADKYLQPGAIFLAGTLENLVLQTTPTMVVQTTYNSISCSTGRSYNFSTASGFVDYVVEC